ncbi:MAG: amidophosphoribosyltransferase [Deltaproteobacteria bacterium]|nr:amidophosphoribosyltransferase [Deltaproteobacteria bacterium]MBW2073842.1 amidophosphoribosyltransferase [Deltaproteobacteria bacterium]RLB83112.1 MAG: amidophosphoribosyltransferase [Deltaproteobacteria bacterium]
MKLCHGPKESCGVFGVFGHDDASKLTYFGLYALQHRGQESAGIVTSTGKSIQEHKGMGLVHEVFNEPILNTLRGHIGIGHVRYSTTGSSIAKNAQPFVVSHAGKTLAIAHNGNLTNAKKLRGDLEKRGSIFQTTMDSEIIVHLLARNIQDGVEEAVVKAVSEIQGAYCCVLMTEDKLMAFRDPNGFRPMCLGALNGSYIVASETCALDLIDAQYIRDIDPGEILIIGQDGLRSIRPFAERRSTFCIFEFIYFARPDSNIFGQNVYTVRKRLGKKLAEEYPLEADFAMPFPDSGNYAAIGFCHGSGIPLEMGVIRNHYVGRTFIEPAQSMRDFGVKVKLNPVREILKRKRVVIVEDSIIRGTTSKMRIKTLREAGAREIHMVVSCPPHRYPCYYGIDFSTKGELIASQHTVEEVKNFIGLDSLCYLSLPGMLEATGLEKDGFCLACFNGKYPIPPEEGFSKLCLEY